MLPEDIELELQNWALWKGSGGWFGMFSSAAISPIYAKDGSRYRESVVPIRAGAAADVDNLVRVLARELREALHACYLREDPRGRLIPSIWTLRRVAGVLGCSDDTYRRRVNQARRLVGDGLAARRRRTEVMRATREP